MNLKMDLFRTLLFIAKVTLIISAWNKCFSAFEEILDGEEDDFEHVFAFYDQVMQGDSSYVEREWYLAFMAHESWVWRFFDKYLWIVLILGTYIV